MARRESSSELTPEDFLESRQDDSDSPDPVLDIIRNVDAGRDDEGGCKGQVCTNDNVSLADVIREPSGDWRRHCRTDAGRHQEKADLPRSNVLTVEPDTHIGDKAHQASGRQKRCGDPGESIA